MIIMTQLARKYPLCFYGSRPTHYYQAGAAKWSWRSFIRCWVLWIFWPEIRQAISICSTTRVQCSATEADNSLGEINEILQDVYLLMTFEKTEEGWARSVNRPSQIAQDTGKPDSVNNRERCAVGIIRLTRHGVAKCGLGIIWLFEEEGHIKSINSW